MLTEHASPRYSGIELTTPAEIRRSCNATSLTTRNRRSIG